MPLGAGVPTTPPPPDRLTMVQTQRQVHSAPLSGSPHGTLLQQAFCLKSPFATFLSLMNFLSIIRYHPTVARSRSPPLYHIGAVCHVQKWKPPKPAPFALALKLSNEGPAFHPATPLLTERTIREGSRPRHPLLFMSEEGGNKRGATGSNYKVFRL